MGDVIHVDFPTAWERDNQSELGMISGDGSQSPETSKLLHMVEPDEAMMRPLTERFTRQIGEKAIGLKKVLKFIIGPDPNAEGGDYLRHPW